MKYWIERFIYSLMIHWVFRVEEGMLKGARLSILTGRDYFSGRKEPAKNRAFIQSYIDGSTLYDIGAGKGYYSYLAAKITNKNSKIYSFELDRFKRGIIKKNIGINGWDNIELFDVMAGKDDRTTLFEGNWETTADKVFIHRRQFARKVKLDTFVKRVPLSPPEFIVIQEDVNEINVL
ncbi:MAG: hypothetical protein LAT68_11650 [Cyclobacteriaceae bacterium]|nr:hypothetical protein [Cyclobacteriaceae bacterium]MCH8516971.1 hypothetical protein [Cyclobacteriaceae bacterium]